MQETEHAYKDDSLSTWNDWISEEINSEATPEEIYATIVNCVERDVEYHDACVKQAKQLLSLLKGQEIPNFDDKITFSSYNDDVINFPSRY